MPEPARPDSNRRRSAAPTRQRGRKPVVPPVLVRQMRGALAESEHRGHVVEVDMFGRVVRAIGDPDHVTTLRSAVKPFGLLALVEAGGIESFDLTPAELAVMASSHSGEDLHVRTLQDIFRRARISQSALACGVEHAPLDALTAMRLTRDGERPGPIRHNCSGNHTALLLLARLGDWPLDGYWEPTHPAMRAFTAAVARAYATSPDRLVTAPDNCGIPTFAFRLREIAWAFALLAAPDAIPGSDIRTALADSIRKVRDAMIANPEMVGGTRDRLDTALMKALPRRVVSKGGAEALRGIGVLPRDDRPPSGVALRISDGDGSDRAGRAAAVETLVQLGVVREADLRQLGPYHRPAIADPHGRIVAQAVASFDLAPVGELV